MTRLSVEQLLERCLEDVARGRDVDAVLRQYPLYADELRPLIEVALAAGRMVATVPEPPGGLAAGRARLLRVAAQRRVRTALTGRERSKRMRLTFATKLVGAILAVVVGVAAVGGGVAWAASDSLPGDALYGAKLALEDLQLAFTIRAENRVELALQFAARRAAEAHGSIEAGSPVPAEVMARMEQQIRYALQWAASAPEEDMPGLLERVAQCTQTQAQILERLRAMAPEETQAGVQEARQFWLQAHEEALAGLGDPQTFRWRYQQREGMPEETVPPEPPTVVPPGGGEEPQGPAGGEGEPCETPQGDQERDQQRDQERDQEGDQQQDQEREQQRDQEGAPDDTPPGNQEQAGGTPPGPQGGGQR